MSKYWSIRPRLGGEGGGGCRYLSCLLLLESSLLMDNGEQVSVVSFHFNHSLGVIRNELQIRPQWMVVESVAVILKYLWWSYMVCSVFYLKILAKTLFSLSFISAKICCYLLISIINLCTKKAFEFFLFVYLYNRINFRFNG